MKLAVGIRGDDRVGAATGGTLQTGALLMAHSAADVACFAERTDIVECVILRAMEQIWREIPQAMARDQEYLVGDATGNGAPCAGHVGHLSFRLMQVIMKTVPH